MGPRPLRLLPLLLVILASLYAAAADRESASTATRSEAVQAARESYRASERIDPAEFPIGVFDSGTGGLAVLEAILAIDAFDNATHGPAAGGDGKADFGEESFIFLADQANMPYGNYPSVGKQAYLEDLIVKDAEFLLGDKHFAHAEAEPARGKAPVKAIVIACNTATAYGKDDIEQMVADAGLTVPVIGVVDAGARGAVDVFADGRSGTIGVLATRGTVLSEAYPRAIRAEAARRGLTHRIDVVQQGSLGLAGAIDGIREFVVPGSEIRRPREAYQGPSLDHPLARIDRGILRRYGFDFSEGRMLFQGPPDQPDELQLNSVENYLRYDLVALLENLRKSPRAGPLRAVVLGCTHFPYYAETFRRELKRLRDYREGGAYPYRDCMAPSVAWIDPARFTARELHRRLVEEKRFDRTVEDPLSPTRGEFFITVPCRKCPAVELTAQGQFAHEYKYGRKREDVGADFRPVPLRPRELDPQTAQRLQSQLPAVWKLLGEFNERNGKAKP
ncbi:MAG: aspartate/glutamate racemase family protein [Pirellulales bacterium]|nr:aspartate/glutamate racemase family protein [Pirellulales bacterium]